MLQINRRFGSKEKNRLRIYDTKGDFAMLEMKQNRGRIRKKIASHYEAGSLPDEQWRLRSTFDLQLFGKGYEDNY